MAEQKQVTRIWRCPATPYDPTGMSLKRKGVTPHHSITDGPESHVKSVVYQFTDKKKLIDVGKMTVDKDNNVLSGPNYFQDIYGDDWSKVFLDLDDGDFATLEEAQEQTEKMKTWRLTTLADACTTTQRCVVIQSGIIQFAPLWQLEARWSFEAAGEAARDLQLTQQLQVEGS